MPSSRLTLKEGVVHVDNGLLLTQEKLLLKLLAMGMDTEEHTPSEVSWTEKGNTV